MAIVGANRSPHRSLRGSRRSWHARPKRVSSKGNKSRVSFTPKPFVTVFIVSEHTISNGFGDSSVVIPCKLRINNLKNPFDLGPFFFTKGSIGGRTPKQRIFGPKRRATGKLKLFRKQFLASKTKFNTYARDWTTTTTKQADTHKCYMYMCMNICDR